jgi:hypothetical protein
VGVTFTRLKIFVVPSTAEKSFQQQKFAIFWQKRPPKKPKNCTEITEEKLQVCKYFGKFCCWSTGKIYQFY